MRYLIPSLNTLRFLADWHSGGHVPDFLCAQMGTVVTAAFTRKGDEPLCLDLRLQVDPHKVGLRH